MRADTTPLGQQGSFIIFALAGLSGLYEHGLMEKSRVLLGALLWTDQNRSI